MSAWIVSKKHIDVLVTWAIDNHVAIKHNGITEEVLDADRVGQALWDENFRSVNYRYNESEKAPEYHFERNVQNLVTVWKSVRCFDYQTCECDDYKTTFAHAFVEAITRWLTECGLPSVESPEYDAAPWGID